MVPNSKDQARLARRKKGNKGDGRKSKSSKKSGILMISASNLKKEIQKTLLRIFAKLSIII